MSNENLRLARQVKNDEFYTRYEDIEKELIKYKDQFKGKIVYCNCDAPESNFIKFFNDVQAEWQIKEVLHTSLKEGVSYDSPKALELLDKCDIVVTNPPFSKVRNEFLPLIERSGKQFLFIGNLNMATFKEVFPLIRDGKLWTGYTHPKEFLQPDGTYKKFGNTLWWTNMLVDKPLIGNNLALFLALHISQVGVCLTLSPLDHLGQGFCVILLFGDGFTHRPHLLPSWRGSSSRLQRTEDSLRLHLQQLP